MKVSAPTENERTVTEMDEYISKESAISIFEAKAEMAVCTPAQPYFHKAAKMIELLPAADVAPVRHGRWIKEGDVVVCSECGEEHAWDEYRATYCEDCGARMDLEV